MRKVLRRVLLLSVLAASSASPAARADDAPRGSAWTEATFASRDGVRLHADVFRPTGLGDRDRTPALLVVSPYLGTPTAASPGPPKVLPYYRRLFEAAIARGHSVVQVSLRGTGASEGCGDFGGPGEQDDVAAALDWTAALPWSTGRVGMVGHSYDGYAALVAVAQRAPALAAAVVIGPAADLYRGIFMNGVGYVQTPLVGAYYQTYAALPPIGSGLPGALAGRRPACALEVVPGTQDPDRGSAFWRERDVAGRLAGATVPTLWAHGFLDGRDDFSAVRPDNLLGGWRGLAGPRRAWLGQFPHLVPGERNTWGEEEPIGRDGFVEEAVDWLEAHVARDARARARVDGAPQVAVQDGALGAWRGVPAWPPPATGDAGLTLLPGAYTDGPGTKAEQGDDPGGGCAAGARARCNPLSRTGAGSWTFSAPLAADLHLAGVARLRATLEAPAGARTIALVYDVGPDARATLLTRGATLAGGRGQVDFELYPQDWRLRRGHRIGVLLSGSDDFYFAPGTTGTQVRVTAGELRLPITSSGAAPLPGAPSRAVRERTSFPVAPEVLASRTGALTLPRGATCATRCATRRPRLTRRCVGAGRLRVRVVHPPRDARAVSFRFGTRVVARDARRPFGRVVARRPLARTQARRLRAVLSRRGAARPLRLTRSLPRCGLRD